MVSIESQLVQSLNDLDKRLKVVEESGVSGLKLQYSQDLTKFQGLVEKQFQELATEVSSLKQLQLHHNKLSKTQDRNILNDLQRKILQLEEKNSRQAVEIKVLQSQLQQEPALSSWSTKSSAIPYHHHTSSDVARIVNVEKRYEDIERQVTMLKVHVSEMELQLQASLASTYNGSFMWRIPDISI